MSTKSLGSMHSCDKSLVLGFEIPSPMCTVSPSARSSEAAVMNKAKFLSSGSFHDCGALTKSQYLQCVCYYPVVGVDEHI